MPTKRQIAAEEQESDRIEDAIVTLGASDFKPLARIYGLSPATLDEAKSLFTKSNKTEFYPTTYCGSLLHPRQDQPRGVIASECKLVSAESRKRLAAFGLIPKRYHGALLNVRYSHIFSNGKCRTHTVTVGNIPFEGMKYRHGGLYAEWFPICKPGWIYSESDACAAADVNLLDIQVSVDFWSVSFALGSAPAVRVPTTKSGVAGMYALRDKPEGLTRRQALRHWVKEHHRKIDDEKSTEVRGHLRGVEDFDWFDLRCRVYPPAQYIKAVP